MAYKDKPEVAEVRDTFKTRLEAEYATLTDQIKKLVAFVGNDVFSALPVKEQNLLTKQLRIQRELAGVLVERIKSK